MEEFERIPPQNLDAEMCLIGSILLSTDDQFSTELRMMVGADDFYQADHQIIWRVVGQMKDERRPVDAITLRERLSKMGLLAEIGGTGYIASMIGSVPAHTHGKQYAAIVKENSNLRRIITAANESIRAAYAAHHSESASVDIVSQVVGVMSKIMSEGTQAEYKSFGAMLVDAYEDLEKTDSPLFTTGIPALDKSFGGIAAGEIVLVGARPSMGKSTLMRQMAIAIARQGLPVGYVSLEESTKKITRNILAAELGIENARLRRREISEDEMKAIAKAMNDLSQAPLYTATTARTPDQFKAMATLMKAKHGIKYLFLDYMGLLQCRGSSDYERASAASEAFVSTVRDLGLCGVVAVQLNRENTKRDDKRPTMGDIRDSGKIEQDADVLILLHREDYYHQAEEVYQPTQVAELIIAKARDSARGITVKLRSELKYQRFVDEAIVPELY